MQVSKAQSCIDKTTLSVVLWKQEMKFSLVEFLVILHAHDSHVHVKNQASSNIAMVECVESVIENISVTTDIAIAMRLI